MINPCFRPSVRIFWLICVVGLFGCGSDAPDASWRDAVDIGPRADAAAEPDAPDTAYTGAWKSGPNAEDIVGPVITVATYNQHLLFDTRCDSGQCGPDEFEQQWSQAEFDALIAQRAAAIDALDADILLLQEVETQQVLDTLNAALSEPYPIAILAETGFEASLDVAVLARGELMDSRVYTQLDNGWQRFSRNFLRLDLEIQGERAIVFSAHFKAKFQDQEGRRIAEAQTAHAIVSEVAAEHDGALVILGGDLNDTPDSEPLVALTEDGKLKLVSEGEELLDIFTFVYQSRRQAIDHLLIAPTRGGRYVNQSVSSVHDPGAHVGWGGSDHNALVGQFEMR